MNYTSARAIVTVNRPRTGTRPSRKFAPHKPKLNPNQRPKPGQRRKQKLNRILTQIQNLKSRLSQRQQQRSSLNLKPNPTLNPRHPPNLNQKPRPRRLLKSKLQPNRIPKPRRHPPSKQNRNLTLKPTLNPPTMLSRSRMPKSKPNLKRMGNLRPRYHRSLSSGSINFTSNWDATMFVPLRNRIRQSKRSRGGNQKISRRETHG